MKLGDQHAKVDGVLEVILVSGTTYLNVTLKCTEFTCRCPVTDQPDWAEIVIEYVPKTRCVESKSLKMYLETFRDTGIYHENLAEVLLADLVKVLDPEACNVTVHFNTRGGIAISATAAYWGKS